MTKTDIKWIIMFLTITRITVFFLFSILSISLFAAAEDSETATTSKLLPALFAFSVLFIGAVKSFSLARREQTSSLCVISLGLVLGGWSISTLIPTIEEVSALGRVILSLVAGVCLLTGGILAIVGLAQYKNHQTYTQGKSQAIWTLIIVSIFIAAAGFAVYSKFASIQEDQVVNDNIQSKKYQFDEYNYQFTTPKAKYVELNKEIVTEDAAFYIMRSNPKVYFTLIAEVAGEGVLPLESLEEIVESNLKSAATGVNLVSRDAYESNGMQGRLLYFDADVSNQNIRYAYWLYEHNGFVYQLIGWVNSKDSHQLEDEFKQLVAGFKMLSSERFAFTKGQVPLGDYNDKFTSIDAENTAWTNWEGLDEDYPAANVGGEIADNSYFNIIPFCHTGNRPHDSAVKYALLNELNIEYPSDTMKERPTRSSNKKGITIIHNWESDDVPHQGRFALIKDKSCDYLVSYWTVFDEKLADENLKKLLNLIEFNTIKHEQLEEKNLKSLAAIYNRTGIYYYNSSNYVEAIKYFKIAHNTNLEYPIYTNNLFDAFNKVKDFKAAKTFIETNLDQLILNETSYSWFGWTYHNLKDAKKSEKYYKIAFEKGYKGDEDLGVYVDILLAQKRLEEADESLNLYAENIDSANIAIKRSEIKRQLKEYDAALMIVNKAQDGKPINTDLIFEKIYIEQDKGDYKKAITHAESLIKEGFASAGAYYQKGVSEYSLAWYVQAKKSFDKALTYSPNNENILDYIKTVSSMLGQGDSTTIANKIDPVEFKAKEFVTNKEKIDNEIFDSYYINKVTAINFKVGEPLKTTKSNTVHLLSDQGVKRYSTIEIDFEPLYETTYINELVLLDKTGKVLSRANRNDFYVTDSDGDEANTTKTIHLPVANLTSDSILRFTYTKQTLSKIKKFPFTKVNLSSTRPVVDSKLYISGDIENINHHEISTEAPKSQQGLMSWSSSFPTPYYDEPMQVSSLSYLPAVVASSKDSNWVQLADDYLESIDEKLIISEKVKILAKEVTKDSHKTEDKIASLIDYIQNNITYKAIEFGVRGRIPNTAENTIGLRYGDCKDHAVLLAALLKSIDINAKLALANLSSKVNQSFPSLDQFNHMIVHLPDIGSGLYIDTTDKDMNLINKAPSSLGDSMVLVLDKKSSEVKRIPEYSVENNSLVSYRDIYISNEEKSLVNEKLVVQGYAGSNMRNYLKAIEPGKRFDRIKNFMAQRNKDLNLLSMEVKNLLDNRLPLSIEAKFEVTNTQLEDGEFIFKDTAFWEYYYLLPSDVVNRKTSFEILYPMMYQSNITINLADEFRANNINSKKTNSENSYIKSNLEISNQENSITKRFELIEKKGIYKKDGYKEYRNSIRESVKELSKVISIKKVAN